MRQLIAIDLESTGLDPLNDRIISIGIVSVCPASWEVGLIEEFIFNPQIEISKEATAVHGYTNAHLMNHPSFDELSQTIFSLVDGRDIVGFNMMSLDLPLLWMEFHRSGLKWEPLKNSIIDVGVLFKKREERTLSAAVKFYLNRTHDSAHSAGGDAHATAQVLVEQLKRYKLDHLPVEKIEPETLFDRPLDVAGKIVIKDGVATYAFGQKTRGKPVVSDIGFAEWILGKDFHPDTKRVVTEILEAHVDSQANDDTDEWFDLETMPEEGYHASPMPPEMFMPVRGAGVNS